MGPIVGLSKEPPEDRDLKEKRCKDVRILGRLDRIVDRVIAVPSPMPMVF